MSFGDFHIASEVLIVLITTIATLTAGVIGQTFIDRKKKRDVQNKDAGVLVTEIIASATNISREQRLLARSIRFFLNENIDYPIQRLSDRTHYIESLQEWRTQLASSILRAEITVNNKELVEIFNRLNELNSSMPILPFEKELIEGAISREDQRELIKQLEERGEEISKTTEDLLITARRVFSKRVS